MKGAELDFVLHCLCRLLLHSPSLYRLGMELKLDD